MCPATMKIIFVSWICGARIVTGAGSYPYLCSNGGAHADASSTSFAFPTHEEVGMFIFANEIRYAVEGIIPRYAQGKWHASGGATWEIEALQSYVAALATTDMNSGGAMNLAAAFDLESQKSQGKLVRCKHKKISEPRQRTTNVPSPICRPQRSCTQLYRIVLSV